MPAISNRSFVLRWTAAAVLTLGSAAAMAQAPAPGGEHGGPPAGAEHGGPAHGPAPAGGADHGSGVAPGGMSPGPGGGERPLPKGQASPAGPARGTSETAPHQPQGAPGNPHAAAPGEKGPPNAAHGPQGAAPGGGQHGAPGHGGRVTLSNEQRTRFRDAIRGHGESIHADFAVNIGAVVPRHDHFYPLPPALIALVPEYRGYDYVIVDHRILIIEPETGRIVDIIDE